MEAFNFFSKFDWLFAWCFPIIDNFVKITYLIQYWVDVNDSLRRWIIIFLNITNIHLLVSEETGRVRVDTYVLRPEEVIFILIVVAVWIVAMVLFYKQWDSIRILQPNEPRYKHNPKNLESIRIVKRPQDSVIYKNYSRKLSITMDEREKRRLQRMNTEPVLPSVSRLSALPTIHMEEATTEMWRHFLFR